jgi:hypothetical protein
MVLPYLRLGLTVTALAAMSLLVSACQMGMDVEVSGQASAPEFSFQRSGPFGFSQAPAVGIIDISEIGGSQTWSLWWTVTNCNPLKRLIYGQIPNGFRELHAPSPLKEGRTYAIEASGCGYIGGSQFKIVHGRVVPVKGR